MPTRSLRSSVFTWPDRAAVEAALWTWTEAAREGRPELQGVGYFGSYARDEWGPGSDLDLVLIADDDAPFERRVPRWDLTALPVPADPLFYTPAEWATVRTRDDRFARMLARELVWVMKPA